MSSHELKQLEAAIAAADRALSIQQQCFDQVVQSHEDLLNDEDAKQLDTYSGDVAASKRDLRNAQRALTKAHSERTQLDFMLASAKATAAYGHRTAATATTAITATAAAAATIATTTIATATFIVATTSAATPYQPNTSQHAHNIRQDLSFILWRYSSIYQMAMCLRGTLEHSVPEPDGD
jgi:hypothetical protein